MTGSPSLRALALATLQPGFVGLTAPEWLLRELEAGLGGVALFGRNIESPEQVAALTAQIHEANPAAIVAIDEEAGDVTRLEHATGSSWPGNLALGHVDDVSITEDVAREIGTMLDSVGVDLDYAPDADVNSNPDNPVIGVRSFGSDPDHVARHTAAWVRGLQSAGILACAKHFPGHGDTAQDSHLELPTVRLGHEGWALRPFRAAIEAGVASIMSAHIVVRDLDHDPATLSRTVLVDLLRGELGFRGLAISDGMEMGGITGSMDLTEGCVRAIGAGIDALCIGGGLAGEDTVAAVATALVDAVRDGRLDEERLAEAAAHVGEASELRGRLRQRRQPSPGNIAGLEAAHRALMVRGPLQMVEPDRPPHLIELTAPSNQAVGDETPSGLAAAVGQRWPGARRTAVATAQQATDLATSLAARTPGKPPDVSPLWIAVRDPHRHDWMPVALDALLRARPDAVIIDTGWPDWSPPTGTSFVATRGASRVTADAAVTLLAGGSPPG
ncbi:hypothetical protein N802_05805 [Knoellia sinensis KCTC 19936]|uniref:Glycoside hydrolase family 3 N-terminal domain-containing protein n=1 Tax=Knoellia sinensis KCTC 19936 TaxID=1385520 RepID=A0A0A0J5M0_9MICO|nr:glycoside hydrolase family 3 N-terminal domain-containing protein [Knoellia sinensis]KGN30911.1 hypothetical protein N802_05805 [Knoellia sinensis KCTC 19936]